MCGGISFPDFTLHYEASPPKLWHWQKNRHTDQRNRAESPGINLQVCDQLIHKKGAKNIHQGKDRPLNKRCWENQTLHAKEQHSTVYTPHKMGQKPSFPHQALPLLGPLETDTHSGQPCTGTFSPLFLTFSLSGITS